MLSVYAFHIAAALIFFVVGFTAGAIITHMIMRGPKNATIRIRECKN